MKLRDTRTGAEVWHQDDSYSDVENVRPSWTNGGNYSCDCNRWMFFARAQGKDPNIDEAKCGEGRFLVIEATLDGVPFPAIVDAPAPA